MKRGGAQEEVLKRGAQKGVLKRGCSGGGAQDGVLRIGCSGWDAQEGVLKSAKQASKQNRHFFDRLDFGLTICRKCIYINVSIDKKAFFIASVVHKSLFVSGL